jgi:hypothetical protein
MPSIHSPARRERDVAQGAAPKFEDFPEAEVVGGAIILNGKNMGTLTVNGDVEPSAFGRAYLDTAEQDAVESVPITEVPDPVPVGVIDPAQHEKVLPVAKQAVRQRKQNEIVVDAMNSPTGAEEAAFQAVDEAVAQDSTAMHPGDSQQGRESANIRRERDTKAPEGKDAGGRNANKPADARKQDAERDDKEARQRARDYQEQQEREQRDKEAAQQPAGRRPAQAAPGSGLPNTR